MLGSVGKDKYSQVLDDEMKKARVETIYQEFARIPTGVCAALVHVYESERSLITSLGASGELTMNFVEEQWGRISAYDFFYLEGFVLNSTPDVVKKIVHYARDKGKKVMLNFSTHYIIQQCYE